MKNTALNHVRPRRTAVKIKTAELTGAALDWAVARSMVPIGTIEPWLWRYSTDWSFGGPIIEREGITVSYINGTDVTWGAYVLEENGRLPSASGATALIAAMRCYVASKLGDEIEIPDELVTAR